LRLVRAKRYRLVTRRFKVRNSKVLAVERAPARAGRAVTAVSARDRHGNGASGPIALVR
jgi:hypothetical protein